MNDRLSLLFDLDGTLVDTDGLHFQAYQMLLSRFSRSISIEFYKSHIMGAANSAIMEHLFPDLTVDQHRELAQAKELLFRNQVGVLEPTPGLMQLLDWAAQENIEVVMVTNAPRDNAELMLHGLGLGRFIERLVIGDELPRGKPDPLPYVTGLRMVAGHPTRALAFEDSLSGVRSASSAGIYTFGIGSGLPPISLIEAGASEVIADFNDSALWDLLRATVAGIPIAHRVR